MGQQFDIQTDLLNMLEEMAVNSTDVPLELINARLSMDYATHYTMSSTKFLRKAYKRQGEYQVFLTEICRKLYICEFGKVDKLSVTLPPPVFLNITNTSQILDNADQYITKIVDLDLGNDGDPALKDAYKKGLIQDYLGTYLDISRNQAILDRARIELKAETKPEETE